MSSQFKFYADPAATVPNPEYEGLFVHYRNGSMFQFDHGNGVEFMYDYRNSSAVAWFLSTAVNGSNGIANKWVVSRRIIAAKFGCVPVNITAVILRTGRPRPRRPGRVRRGDRPEAGRGAGLDAGDEG